MIKNYTSGVPPERSVMHIEKALVRQGAKNILKDYNGSGTLIGIAFMIETEGGKVIPFKLPARVDRVEKRLIESVRRPRPGTMNRIREQGERTSWKILADWVDIQMALVDLDQAELLEVFLPYHFNPVSNQTFFEKIKSGNLKLLGE